VFLYSTHEGCRSVFLPLVPHTLQQLVVRLQKLQTESELTGLKATAFFGRVSIRTAKKNRAAHVLIFQVLVLARRSPQYIGRVFPAILAGFLFFFEIV